MPPASWLKLFTSLKKGTCSTNIDAVVYDCKTCLSKCFIKIKQKNSVMLKVHPKNENQVSSEKSVANKNRGF